LKKIIYWSPHINTQIATVKAVINSAKSLSLYTKNYEVIIINVFGEWDNFKEQCKVNKITLIDLTNFKIKLPIHGFIKSRLFYMIIGIISIFRLPFLIKEIKPDYFIAHLIVIPILFISRFFSHRTNFILRISGLPKLNFFRVNVWRILSKHLYAITCPTISTKNQLLKIKIFNNERIYLLEDPIINIRKLPVKNDSKALFEKDYVLSVGRLTYQKNFDFLINNYSKILKEINYKKLIIIGSGEDRYKLKNLISSLNADKFIKILDYQKNIYPYYKNADCFILTSRWEDPGFVLIEAAANNVAVLSSDCPNGPKEFTKNELNGYAFSNNNKKEFRKKLITLLNNLKSEEVIKKKISAKKYIKRFTIFSHFLKLQRILN
tara:strand:- start:19299 stop:20432 length:1134 start_codon:yes stop_codon:yes gene_type:complete